MMILFIIINKKNPQKSFLTWQNFCLRHFSAMSMIQHIFLPSEKGVKPQVKRQTAFANDLVLTGTIYISTGIYLFLLKMKILSTQRAAKTGRKALLYMLPCSVQILWNSYAQVMFSFKYIYIFRTQSHEMFNTILEKWLVQSLIPFII